MKKAAVLFIFLFIGFSVYSNLSERIADEKEISSQPASSRISIGSSNFTIEIASSDTQRAQGLSNRDSMERGHGMLFLFDTKDNHGFWMKDMRFSLDFVWIADDRVVDITENVPPPVDNYTPVYRPKEPVNKMLELNSGEIKEAGIKIGDTVSVTFINQENSP